MKISVYSKRAKMKLYAIALTGAVLLTSLTGCSEAYNIKVAKDTKLYPLTSLSVLANEERDYHICDSERYKTITEKTHGYRFGFGWGTIDGEYKYGYGYTYGEMDKQVSLYEYIDIDSGETIANDENMNGYSKSNLSNFFSEEEYKDMEGQVDYADVVTRVEERVCEPFKRK